MLEIFITDEFRDRYRELPSVIQKKFSKQLRLFKNDPYHPSLHTEKLQPKDRQYWSFRIDRSYRAIFKFTGQQQVILLTVGPHGWIYRF